MQEESLFHEALARSSLRERAAFLDRKCAKNAVLRAAVEALLSAHEQSGEFLSPAAIAVGEWEPDRILPPAVKPPNVPDQETENRAGSTDADKQLSVVSTLNAAADTASLATDGRTSSRDQLRDRIGRYEIREELGRGGMGTVYLAHDPELDRLIALKVPKLAGPEAQERFLREARAAAAVSHPNLCPVYDAGNADGVAYLAMAYVPGETLTDLLKRDGTLTPVRATEIAAGVARGMAEAHRHGIVHRDLKPGNILFDRNGDPVVTDFGLARREKIEDLATDPDGTLDHDPRLTQAGALMGTPAYMPPEQARGELDKIGPASDVYALGAILFEMLRGRPPFRGDTISETLKKIENDPMPSMTGSPAGLVAICRRALSKDPAERIPSMGAFNEELAAIVRRRRVRRSLAVAAGAFLVLLIASVVLYIKTDNGTVEVRLSDPTAEVQIMVDGKDVVLSDNGRVTKLRPGEHGLEVKGEGYTTVTRLFKLTRGDKVVLEVELKPREIHKGAPKPGSLSPDRTKLAGLLERGRQRIRMTQFAELGPIADEALQLDAESPGALALRATYRASRNDIVNARADAEASLKLNAETHRALAIRAYLDSNEGKYDEAIADLTVAVRLDPADFIAWSNRASCYFRKDEFRQAIADATRAIERGFLRGDAHLIRGAAHACLGDYPKALVDYDVAIAREPQSPAGFNQRSAVHFKAGDKEKAAADWARAKELEKSLTENERAIIPVSDTPERKKLNAADKQALEKALIEFPKALTNEKADECNRLAELAVRLDSTCAEARSNRARLWIIEGKSKEAIVEATEAIRLDSKQAWAYWARGASKNFEGARAAAVADLTICLERDPSIATAWAERGFAFMERKQFYQSLSDLNEAVKRGAPADLGVANRGSCYLHLGEFEKALADYTTAAEAQPTDPEWRMSLAGIYARLGKLDEWQKQRDLAAKIDKKLKDAKDLELPPVQAPLKKDPE
jgi:tetratricopeptide (TPR) repeat protein